MVINQGDIYWITLKEPRGSDPGYRHPHVIIQNNIFNRSLINTVVVCALTSNLKRATVNKNDLSDKIGSLTRERFKQVDEGIKLLTQPTEVDDLQ
jgi:mRNA interferase MazF